MENRKPLRLFILVSAFFFTLGASPRVLAYGVETHAYLTDEIINFYNQSYSDNLIGGELKSYIVDGARREDDAPRYLNHFYDPVNNKGLDDPEWGKGFSSKEWAQSDSKQTTYAYKPISYVASILTASEQGNVDGMDLNFTWNQAIRYYRDSEVEKAMLALGHVLHLMEDTSVPDHTRNDAHPHPLGDGSPYEKYTEKFTGSVQDKELASRLSGKKPFDSMPTLSNYFDEMANYSNNNFYSEDTIDKIYNLPKPDYFKKEDDYNIAFRKDENGSEYRLYAKKYLELDNSRGEQLSLLISGNGNDKIVADYWSRLSAKSVQVGAGVIKLFFDDIERVNYGDTRLVRDDRNPITWAIDNTKAFAQIAASADKALTSSLSNALKNAFTNIFWNTALNDENLTQVVDLNSLQENKNDSTVNSNNGENESSEPPTQAVNKQGNTQQPQQIKQTIEEERETEEQKIQQREQQIKNETQGEQIQQTQKQTSQTTNIKECSFGSTSLATSNTSQSLFHEKIIINEVAWMGGSSDFGLTSTDEWIELKNISGGEVDVSGWQLIDKAEQIKINLGFINETKIKAGQFILLERTDDDSVPNAPADLIYSNTLNNSDEGLRLFDSQCNLVDKALANPDWSAGDNTQKRTMERSPDLSWHTYNGTAQNNIVGTPKKENSTPVVVYGGGGGGSSTQNNQSSQSSVAGLMINEIMYDLPGSDSGREWIEIKNTNSSTVDATEIKLNENNTNHSLTLSQGNGSIPAGGFAVIANDVQKFLADNPSYPGIILKASFSLNNTGELLALKAVDTSLDQFSYSSSLGANGDGKSLQLVNGLWLAATPTPGLENSASISSSNLEIAPFSPLQITQVIYDPDGSDEGNELVEVTNPNDEQIDINLYSLQYLGPSSDFAGIEKKNFQADNIIPAQGIFKIGINCHTNTPCVGVDMSWSQALGNESGTAFIVSNQELLTGFSDPDIVDGFHYPQVTQLIEPSNLVANYNPDRLEINLSWDSNLSLIYQIQEYSSPGVTIFEGKGSFFTKRVDEVGRNYKFSVRAFNENAEHTGLIEKEITVPSFIKDTSFYNSTHYTSQGGIQENLIEFSYNNYPFLPLALVYAQGGVPTSGPNYKTLVFYLNTEAPKRVYLNGTAPLAEDINNVLRVKYEICASANSLYASLVLPDTAEKCNTGGGFGNGSMAFNRYLAEGDKHLLLSAESSSGQSVFTGSDYITVVFYGLERDFPQGTAPIDGIYPNFKLLAVDKTKYYFKSGTPAHSTPQLTGEITFNFDKQNSKLNVNWPSATDSDTLDALLTYEIKYISSGDWQPVGGSTNTTKIVSAGDIFSVSVRAKDDFGNYSTPVLIKEWSYPATDFTFVQSENNTLSSSFGLGYGYYGSDGNGINLQSLAPINTLQFDKASLRVKQTLFNDNANLKLSVYSDSNNQPDFSSALSSSVISNISNPDSNSDLTFHFVSPVSLSANSKYWLALEVESYSDSMGFFRNSWQNAISDANPYLQGEAASIKVKVTNGVYSYSGFTIEPSNDWYVKLGLER